MIWSKSLLKLIFNPCGEFRWSPEDPVSQIHSPHLHVGAPEIFSDLLRYVQMVKRGSGVRKAKGSYRTYSSLVKLQRWVLSLRWKTCLRQNCNFSSRVCSGRPAFGHNCNLDTWVCGGRPAFGRTATWFLRLQWRTCIWAEHSDDDDDDDDDVSEQWSG